MGRTSAGSALRMLALLTIGHGGLAATSACEQLSPHAQQRSQLALYLGADSMGHVPLNPVAIAIRGRHELVENSAATMTPDQPGIIFSINDSGNEPVLFALDTTGVDRGAWRISDATNNDWEAMSLGPCSAGDTTRPVTAAMPRCIYIGDTGDNSAERTTRTIYRIAEPRVKRAGFTSKATAERLKYSYDDGPHDVEAMYVAPDGSIILITKRPLVSSSGRLRPALVFTLGADAWRGKTAAVARLVDSLPIVPGSAPLRYITDAALSPNARHLAVRTYAQVFVFATDSSTGRVIRSVPPTVCNVASLGEQQGEGIAWYGTTDRLLLTSEGRRSPMYVISCPLPAR